MSKRRYVFLRSAPNASAAKHASAYPPLGTLAELGLWTAGCPGLGPGAGEWPGLGAGNGEWPGLGAGKGEWPGLGAGKGEWPGLGAGKGGLAEMGPEMAAGKTCDVFVALVGTCVEPFEDEMLLVLALGEEDSSAVRRISCAPCNVRSRASIKGSQRSSSSK